MSHHQEALANWKDGPQAPTEHQRHLKKLKIFVDTACESLFKHFPRWLNASLLPAALLSEAPTAAVIASVTLDKTMPTLHPSVRLTEHGGQCNAATVLVNHGRWLLSKDDANGLLDTSSCGATLEAMRRRVDVAVVVLSIKGSHFGSASWVSYLEGLSTHQWKCTIFDFNICCLPDLPCSQAPP